MNMKKKKNSYENVGAETGHPNTEKRRKPKPTFAVLE
jgi:hypothetical protein